MSRYVLVHGAWEGAWSWESVTPVLEAGGHEVVSVELPGSLSNMQGMGDVNADSYVETVGRALAGGDGRAILVGHSLGGTIISQAAERYPEQVGRLVYVTAFLLESGGSALEAMQSDSAGQLLPKLVFSEDQSYATVSSDVWREVAFHDAEASAIEAALPRLAERQAVEPFVKPLVLTEENFGAIAKTYVRTSIDRILTPALQDRMIGSWPVERVHTLQSGHFPALSRPSELASVLLLAAGMHKAA